jgi:hypothetical protein
MRRILRISSSITLAFAGFATTIAAIVMSQGAPFT